MWSNVIVAGIIGCASAAGAFAELVSVPVEAVSPALRERIARFNESTKARVLTAPLNVPDLNDRRRELDAIRRAVAEDLLGKGFDLWSKGMFERCVTPSAITLRPVPADGRNPHNVYNVRQIETLAEHQENRSSGANASLTYKLVSFGGGTAEESGSVFRRTSKYLDIFIRFVGDEYSVNRGAPTPTAVGALAGAGGHERFAKLCGQQFISRVGFGATLDARLSAVVSIDSNASSNKNEVSIGFKDLLSFGADSAATVKKLNQHATLSTQIAGAGGVQPKPEELMDYALRFGAGNPAADSAQEVYVETTPYSEVGYKVFAAFDDVAEQAMGTVLDLYSDRSAVIQQRAELESAIENPDLFQVDGKKLTGAELVALRKVQSDYLDQLGKTWDECRKALSKAGIEACKKAAPSSRPPPLRITLAP
ncbi:MAG: hypothetical protein DI587_24850 [Variovorax paradoxus]|nr:MAG: hypothetical protein DI583_24850 [Variovorax paradoxus]PZQ05446.1 MAG: hypothetical protein DI587_24850 [Variovorax paradoxus]